MPRAAHNVLLAVNPVRALILIVLSVACGGRPAVINKLSELPGDPGKRDAVLDSAHAQFGPEQRQRLSPKLERVETAVATAAAVIGNLFSKTSNVTFGRGGVFDETSLSGSKKRPTRQPDGDPKSSAPREDPIDGATLVPWVRLR